MVILCLSMSATLIRYVFEELCHSEYSVTFFVKTNSTKKKIFQTTVLFDSQHPHFFGQSLTITSRSFLTDLDFIMT